MGLTVAGVLLDAAKALQHQAGQQSSAGATAVMLAGATVMRVAAQLVDGMSDADAVKTLEAIRDGGTTPITQAAKDAQVGSAVDHALGR